MKYFAEMKFRQNEMAKRINKTEVYLAKISLKRNSSFAEILMKLRPNKISAKLNGSSV
jgi:hypothetical protein